MTALFTRKFATSTELRDIPLSCYSRMGKMKVLNSLHQERKTLLSTGLRSKPDWLDKLRKELETFDYVYERSLSMISEFCI